MLCGGVLFLIVATAGCDRAPLGAACLASAECASGLCYVNLCLDPDADDDDDGLTNARERALRTHPQRADTDDDGKLDGVEVGPGVPFDRDGDGLIDALESQTQDADFDCLPDEVDAHNLVANTDPAVLARDVCSREGVCADQAAHISATCQIGVGALTCVYDKVPNWSAIEVCDGLDNDCDGTTDEGHSYQGTAVGKVCQGEGACGQGVVQCTQGRAACSTNPNGSAAQASEELCNGEDDDCDGETDEGFGLADAPVGVPCLGTGECGVGLVICGQDGVPLCSTDPGGGQSQAVAELCNSLDDDCDGQTDEQIALAGVPIGGGCMGRGACGPGTLVCDAKGVPVCSSDPEGPASKAKPESCNGLDDNCNGQTDEGFGWQGAPLGATCEGVGSCGKGVVVCSAGGKATCSTQPDAPNVLVNVEQCDGADDDCDGATDEGFVWQGQTLGKPCTGSGVCGAGVVECSTTGAVTCSSNADGSKPESTSESCNGLDDDCDGVIDGNVPAAAGPVCAAIGICASATGTPTCISGVWSCAFDAVGGYQGPNETSCDGLDNDCDGFTDEGLPHTWAPAAKLFDAGAPAPRWGESAAAGASATAFCVAGGLAARVTSTAPDSPGEMWCLSPLKGSWRLLAAAPALARVGAALVAVPSGWSSPNAGPAWWLLGGVSATGGEVSAVSVDAATGEVSPLSLPGVVQAGTGYVVGGDLLQIPRGAVGSAKVTRLTRTSGAWTVAAATPQPPVAYVATTCQDTSGGVWLYGLSATPTAAAATDKPITGSLWHLPAGAKTWIKRPSPPPAPGWNALHRGRLICEPAPGQIWLHGARANASATAAILGLRRFDIKSGAWSVPSVDVTPKISGGYAGRVGQGAVMAWGRTASSASAAVWAVKNGSWVVLQPGPVPAMGARLLQTPKGLLRVGGAGVLHTLESTAGRPAWLRTAAGWQRLAAPASLAAVSQRVWPLVLPIDADNVLVWGGVTDLPAPATQSVFGGSYAPAPGGARLNLSSGVWTALTSSAAAALPHARTGAVLCSGVVSGKATGWLFGTPAAGGKAHLWRVDLATATSAVLWAGAGVGPTATSGVALLWDAQGDRILHIAATSGLQVWAWPLGGGPAAGKWTLLASDVGSASGAVVVLGDLTIDDPLVVILPTDPGGKPALRRLKISGTPSLSAVPLTPPTWRVPAQSVWTAAGAIVSAGPHASGLPMSGVLAWPRACLP